MSAREAFLRSPAATHVYGGGTRAHERVRTLASFRNRLGQRCKRMQQTVAIAGSRVAAIGTVCQRSDRRWVFVDCGLQPGRKACTASRMRRASRYRPIWRLEATGSSTEPR